TEDGPARTGAAPESRDGIRERALGPIESSRDILPGGQLAPRRRPAHGGRGCLPAGAGGRRKTGSRVPSETRVWRAPYRDPDRPRPSAKAQWQAQGSRTGAGPVHAHFEETGGGL